MKPPKLQALLLARVSHLRQAADLAEHAVTLAMREALVAGADPADVWTAAGISRGTMYRRLQRAGFGRSEANP